MSETDQIHQQPAGIGYDTGEPRGPAIAVVLLIFVAVLVAVYFGVDYYFTYIKEKEVYEKVLAPTSEILRNVRNRENWNLNTWQYLDRNKTVVRIPIDRAMELTLKDYAANQVSWPTKPAAVKPPEPVGGPAPVTPGATTAAPGATPAAAPAAQPAAHK